MTARAPLLVLFCAFALRSAEAPPAASLFEAIRNADTGAVRRLLSNGVNPNVQDADGTPALMAAVLYAGADCMQLLLDGGADPNAANAAGATALMWAIPDLAKVKLLVARGANVNARSTNLRRTPLLVAASYPETTAILQLLLDKGADLHAKDRAGSHALGRATLNADLSVVRFLVEHGCDPNEPGYPGGANSRRFARHDQAIVEYLLSKGAKVDPGTLTFAATWHAPQLLEKWIAAGADVNAHTGPYGRTPLMTASASEQATPAALQMLLEKGADPNAEDSEGERPLDWATYRGRPGPHRTPEKVRRPARQRTAPAVLSRPRRRRRPAPRRHPRHQPVASCRPLDLSQSRMYQLS